MATTTTADISRMLEPTGKRAKKGATTKGKKLSKKAKKKAR